MSHDPLSILFVSDIPGSAERTKQILEQTDLKKYQFDSVTGLVEALGIVVRKDYDVCVLDCLERSARLIPELRRVRFDPPIVVLTADSVNQVLDAIHQGAADCLLRENLSAPALEQSICAAIDRAQNLESRAQYERCYLGLMENASEIIYTHDLEGHYTSISKAGERMLGYSAEELLQMDVRQIVAPEYLLSVWREISRMLANRQQGFFDAVVLTKDGRRVHLDASIHLIYKEGSPIGVQGIARKSLAMPSVLQACAERSTSA
jgi:PAS domain S-box-containing protein